MDYLPGLLLAYAACGLGLLSPGPNILAVLGTSMAVGRGAGTALALGVASGSFLWSLLTVGGLTALLAAFAWMLGAIKVAGGSYLLWLAYKSFRAAAAHDDVTAASLGAGETRLRYFLRGLTVQMTNPKAALTWIAIVSLGLSPTAPLWVAAALVIGTALLSVSIHVIYARVFSSAPMMRVYGRARRWIQGILGAFFAFAGLRLLTSRL